MKAIQKELGEMDEAPNEMEELNSKIAKSGMPKDTRKKADAELNKLKMMPPCQPKRRWSGITSTGW